MPRPIGLGLLSAIAGGQLRTQAMPDDVSWTTSAHTFVALLSMDIAESSGNSGSAIYLLGQDASIE